MNTQVKPKATLLDLDSLLDAEVDKIENVPDFVTPPPGLYKLKVTNCEIKDFDEKEDGKKTGNKGKKIHIFYSVLETEAIDDDGKEIPVADGSLFSESFMGTEDGLKYFKKAASNILGIKEFEGAKIRDIIEGIKEAEFRAKITHRITTNDKGAKFVNLTIRAAAAAEADAE